MAISSLFIIVGVFLFAYFHPKAIQEALLIISGGKSLGYYIAGFFFAGLAILLSLYHSSKNRDKNSINTPYNFSWRFLIWDNLKRVSATIIVMFILFRMFNLQEPYLMIGVGFIVSFFLDQMIELLMKSSDAICNLLSSDRSKFVK